MIALALALLLPLQDADSLFKAAEAKYAREDWDGAIADYTKVLELEPRNVAAWNNRGNARDKKGDLEGALLDYSKAIEIDPNDVIALRNRANQYIDHRQDYAAGLADVEKALRLKPDYAEAYVTRGIARLHKNELDAAAADFEKGIALKPSDSHAWNGRGNVKLRRRQIDEAIADYTKAIELDPKNAHAFRNRGIAKYYHKKDADGALADYTASIQADPAFAAGYGNRAVVREAKGDLDGALADLVRAIELDPKRAARYGDRAEFLARRHEWARCIEDCTKAIELDPKVDHYFAQRAIAKRNLGDLEGALVDCTVGFELAPRDTWYPEFRAQVKKQRGDLAGAIADYGRAILLEPEASKWYSARADLREEAGLREEAVADLDKVIELEEEPKWALSRRGFLRGTLGDADGAEEDFERALEIAGKFGPAFRNRAHLRFHARDWKGAVDDFRRGIEADPAYADYPRLWTWLARRRRGDGAEADRELAEYVAKRPAAESPQWWPRLAEFALGKLGEEELFKAAEVGSDRTPVWQRAESRYFAAMRRLMAGETAAAKGLLEKCVELSPKDYYEHYASLAELKRLGERAPFPADPKEGAALQALDDRAWPRVEELLGALVAADPAKASWTWHRGLAEARRELGRPRAAIESYEAAIQAAGPGPEEKARMLASLGDVYVRLRMRAKAVAAYARAAELGPVPADAQLGLARTCLALGDLEAAWKAAERVIAADPARAEAHFLKGSALFGSVKVVAGTWVAPAGTAEALKKYLELAPEGEHAAEAKELLGALAQP